MKTAANDTHPVVSFVIHTHECQAPLSSRMVRSPKSSSQRHSSSNQKSKRHRHSSSSASEDDERRQRYQRRHRSQSPSSTTSEKGLRHRVLSVEVRVKQEPMTDTESHQRRPQRPRPAPEKSHQWGKQTEEEKSNEPPVEKEKPNFGLSGALLKDTNTYKGVVIKYSEPIEARKPKRRWRWYVFKGEQVEPPIITKDFHFSLSSLAGIAHVSNSPSISVLNRSRSRCVRSSRRSSLLFETARRAPVSSDGLQAQ